MPEDSSTLWSPMPVEVWREVLEHLPRPLTLGQVEADLQHLLTLHRFRGERFPSSRALADRWGWGRQRVRSLLKASNPLATQQQPRANPELTQRDKGEARQSGENNPEPTQSQPRANPPATTRALGKDKHKDNTEKKDTCRSSTEYEQVLDHLAGHRPSARRWRKSKGNGQELVKLVKAFGVEQSQRLITLAYTSSQDPHPFNRKRGKGHPSIATLRRHGQRYLEADDDSTSPGGRRGAYRGPANPKPLPTHEQMLAMLAEPAPFEAKGGA